MTSPVVKESSLDRNLLERIVAGFPKRPMWFRCFTFRPIDSLELDGDGFTWLDVAMKRIKIAEFKDHLSEHLRAVERGVEMEVTDRNRPIVRLVPAAASPGAVIVPAHRPFTQIRAKRFRAARWSVRSLDLLLEERGQR